MDPAQEIKQAVAAYHTNAAAMTSAENGQIKAVVRDFFTKHKTRLCRELSTKGCCHTSLRIPQDPNQELTDWLYQEYTVTLSKEGTFVACHPDYVPPSGKLNKKA